MVSLAKLFDSKYAAIERYKYADITLQKKDTAMQFSVKMEARIPRLSKTAG